MSGRRWISLLPDLLLLAGAGGLLYGAALIYRPAAWVLGGLLTMAAAVHLTRLERERGA